MSKRYPEGYDDEFINIIKDLIDRVFVQGQSLQEIVAEGQLTPEQYAELLTVMNGLLKSGEIGEYDLNSNLQSIISKIPEKVDKNGNEQIRWGMLDQFIKEQFTGGNTPVVGENSVNTSNLVDNAATYTKRTRLGDDCKVQLTGKLPEIDIVNQTITFDDTFRVVIGKTRYEVSGGKVLDYSSIRSSSQQIMIYFDTNIQDFILISPANLNNVNESSVLFGILGYVGDRGLRDVFLPCDYTINRFNPGTHIEQLLRADSITGATISISFHTSGFPHYKRFVKDGEVVREDEFSLDTTNNIVTERRRIPPYAPWLTLKHDLNTLETEVY